MSNEELKQNLTSPNQWVRLIYMVLFAVLLEIAGFVMLAVVIAQFLFSIFSGGANDNLRRLGDQIASFIYQTLQFLIYNSEEKPFPFSEWPESEEDDLSSYASAEEVDGEVIGADAEAEAGTAPDAVVEDSAAKNTKPETKVTDEARKEAPEVSKVSESTKSTDAPKAEALKESSSDAVQETGRKTGKETGKKTRPSKKATQSDDVETVIELGSDASPSERDESVRETAAEKSSSDK